MLWGILGGLLMGTYPLSIKSKPVLDANVHPIIFQSYKASMVAISSAFLLLPRVIEKDEYVFVYSPWAFTAAACWVPNGLITIATVPLLGMGLSSMLICSFAVVLSFVFGWLLLDEVPKLHHIDGYDIYLAPFWLCGLLIANCGIIAAPKLDTPFIRNCNVKLARFFSCCFSNRAKYQDFSSVRSSRTSEAEIESDNESASHSINNRTDSNSEEKQSRAMSNPAKDNSAEHVGTSVFIIESPGQSGDDSGGDAARQPHLLSSPLIIVEEQACQHDNDAIALDTPPISFCENLKKLIPGVMLTLVGGFCSAAQYLAISLGKKYEEDAHHCDDNFDDCPRLKEEFDASASWSVSFAFSSLPVTLFYLTLVGIYHKYYKRIQPAIPSFHWNVMKYAGSFAGFFYSAANVVVTIGVAREGNATVMAMYYTFQLLTSGLWGMFYYKEVNGLFNMFIWFGSAAFAMGFIVLLQHEKQ